MKPLDQRQLFGAELLSRIAQQDDKNSFREFYRLYFEGIFQLAISIIKSRELAEEIVEDVFIRIWEKRRALPVINNITVYLFVITRNISLNYLRQKKSRSFIDIENPELLLLQVTHNPENILITSELLKQINVAINALPSQCKIIFRLVKEDGLRYKEVAQLLDLSEKTVENQVGIALKRIHNAIHIFLP